MPPRRIISLLGPTAAAGALAAGIGCSCVTWSIDAPRAAAFVSRGLAEDYGVALAAKGPLAISLLPLPCLGFRDVRLSAGGPDGPVLAEGGTLSIQLNLTAALLGRAEIVALGLDGATVILPDDESDARWDGPLRRLAGHLSSGSGGHPRRVVLNDLALAYGSGAQAVRDLDLTLSWPLWSDRLQLAGNFGWHNATARFALSELRAEALARNGASPFKASLAWPAGSLDAEGTGTLRDGLAATGHANLQANSLSETLAWLGRDVALSPLIETAALEGAFEADRESLRIPSLRLTAGGTVLDGAGSIDVSGDRPSIRATLATDTLNLGPVLAGVLRVAGLDGEAEGWGRHSLALAPLTGGDLDLRLSSNAARLGPMRLDDIATSVIVRRDAIDATLVRAGVQGGTLKGHLLLAKPGDDENAETEIKAQGAFTGLDLGVLLVEAGEQGWILGPTRGVFALDGRGRDADSLVRRISGRASLAMDDGAIAGLDLADVIYRGGAAAPSALAWRNNRTLFERADVSLAFSDGIGAVTEGSLKARGLSATLRGQLSIPDKQVLAQAELLPRNAAGAINAPNGPPMRFEIAGPWDAVGVKAAERKEGGEPLGFAGSSQSPADATVSLPARARANAQ